MISCPSFFTNGDDSRGILSYCNNTFYIAKHEPNNIVRIDMQGHLIDVAAFPQRNGELEQIVVCGNRLFATSQINFYSNFLHNLHEISYNRNLGQSDSKVWKYNDEIFVSQDEVKDDNNRIVNNIKRDGSEKFPFYSLEEALYFTQDREWSKTVVLLSDLKAESLKGANVRVILRGYTINKLTLYDSNIGLWGYEWDFEDKKISDKQASFIGEHNGETALVSKPLQAYNSNVYLANITFYSKNYDVTGSGWIETTKAISKADFNGAIVGTGASETVNTTYSKSLTNGFIATRYSGKGQTVFDIGRIGSYFLFSVLGRQNFKTMLYPYSSLISAEKSEYSITRYDTFVYNETICLAKYKIKTTRTDETFAVNVTVTIMDAATKEELITDDIPALFAATF